MGHRVDVRPALAAERLSDLLGYIDELFASHGIVSWVAGDTLLSCIRDGELLPWTSEAEIVVRGEDFERLRSVLEGARSAGYDLVSEDSTVLGGGVSPLSVAGRGVAVRLSCAGASGPHGSLREPAAAGTHDEIFPLRRRRLGRIEVNVPHRSAAILVRSLGVEGIQLGRVACRCQAARGRYLFEVRAEPARPVADDAVPTRIVSGTDGEEAPRIDRKSVDLFFAGRAAKVASLGPTTAVIYQDKNPGLALRRDAAERALLLPKLGIAPGTRVLDLGCGTGRWAAALVDAGACYHGIDACEGFVAHARALHVGRPAARFTVCPADSLDLGAIGESDGFDRILCLGLLIYLNDEEVAKTLGAMAGAARPHARILLREPVGIGGRLTIRNHYSGDMDQMYHAVYRTEGELLRMIGEELEPKGFRVVERGDVFEDASLNNRAETRQRWLLLER